MPVPWFPHALRRFTTAAILTPLFLQGCAKDAINRDAKTTFLTSDDMIAMTNQMAKSITSDPYLAQQMAAAPLKIVIKPVINETSEIIRDNRRELFVARLQGLLAQSPALSGRIIWIVNRDDYEKLRQEEIPESTLGPSEDRIQPEYALYAKFLTNTNATRNAQSDDYLCQYYITRISGQNTSEQIWTGQYETSKHIKKEFLD